MLVVMDTTALVQELPIELVSLSELVGYCRRTGAVLCIPEVVEVEFAGYLQREASQRLVQIRKGLERLPERFARAFDYGAFSKELSAFQLRVTSYIQDLFKRRLVHRLPISAETARLAVHRAVERRAPCTPGGEQVRDAMIWEAALHAVREFGGPLVLITNDRAFDVDQLSADAKELEVDLLAYQSIRQFLNETAPLFELPEPHMVERLIPLDQLVEMISVFVAQDPTFAWESAVSNMVEGGVLDLILGSYKVVSVSEVKVTGGYRRPIGQKRYNDHVLFEAVVGVSCEAFDWEILPPKGEGCKVTAFEPHSRDDGEKIENLPQHVERLFPRKVPTGSAKQVELELGVRGEAVLVLGGPGRGTSPVLVGVEPWDAGLKGQPRLSKRIDLWPEEPNAWHKRGDSLHSVGCDQEALNAYEQAIVLRPNFPEAWASKGHVLRTLRRYQEALDAVEEAISLKPDLAEAWFEKGDILSEMGRYEEALHAYDRALKLKPDDPPGWYGKGTALADLGRHEEALHAYDKALRLKPDYASAWYRKGNALADLARLGEALEAYDKALHLRPDFPEAWNNKANVLIGQGRHEEALAGLNEAIRLKADLPEAWCNKGNALYDLGRYDEAVDAYEQLLRLRPGDAMGWNNKADALKFLERYEEALDAAVEAIKLKPDLPEAWYNKGNVLHGLGRYNEALEAYDKALRFRPNFPYAWASKGATLAALGRDEEAKRWLCQAWHARKALPDQGAGVKEELEHLGSRPEEWVNKLGVRHEY